jgi:hypothetical protein
MRAVGFAALVAAGLAAQEGLWTLDGGALQATVAIPSVAVASLQVRGTELLVAPGSVNLVVRGANPVRIGPALAEFGATEVGGTRTIRGRDPASGVQVAIECLAGADLEFRVTLVAEEGPRQEAAIELVLPLRKQALRGLFPSMTDHCDIDFTRRETFGFRSAGTSLVMPVGILYEPQADWGLTACAEFRLPTRGFEMAIEPGEPASLRVARTGLRLEPGRPVTVSLILAGHEGDWRPGLGRVLERFPEFFVVADERVPDLHGAFVCSGPTDPDDGQVEDWADQGVRTVEVHGTLPWYGTHLPVAETWTAFADDQWHTLKLATDPNKPTANAPWPALHAYVQSKVPPTMSVARINDFIERLHQRGMYALMYFNPTEAWQPWIVDTFRSALVQDGKGEFIPVWYESYLLCPDPDSPWGQYLVGQFEKMMDLYPKADGFFMDQSTYDTFDLAHDDGWSLSGGQTGYRLGWAIDQLSERLRKLAKARGKFLWWNGPYNSDIAYYAEGMMAEAGGADSRAIQYLAIGGRAGCSLSVRDELSFQNCVAYGLFPTRVATPELRALAARYRPVFELFKGKCWELAAHALELPPGVEGNCYRRPNGDVLVTMVTQGRAWDGKAFDLNLPLVVRLPDAADFRAAYLLSPDLLGRRRLPSERAENELRLRVPRHQTVSAVLLAKAGQHLSVQGPLVCAQGQSCAAMVVAEDLGTGQTAQKPLQVAAALEAQEARLSVVASVSLGGRELSDTFEFYIEKPLALALDFPAEVRQGQPTAGRLQVANSTTATQAVSLGLGCVTASIEPAEVRLEVPPGEARTVPVTVTAARAGPATLKAVLNQGQESIERPFEVLGTVASPSALRNILSARLEFEVFGSDAGKYANKPVFLNGVRIGLLPQHGDTWGAAAVQLPREAVATLAADNELRVENEPGDAFKLARFQLRLCLRNGNYLVSERNEGVFTGWRDWAFGEGQCFDPGTPMTGIHVRIPMDPNSQEVCEDRIGRVLSAELTMELAGSDAGVYTDKPVVLNGVPLGMLPSAPDAWSARTMPLPQEAIDVLGFTNAVSIANSEPKDAFKVRKLQLRLRTEGGREVRSDLDPGVYTSVDWLHAEGKIGMPIEVELRLGRRGGEGEP